MTTHFSQKVMQFLRTMTQVVTATYFVFMNCGALIYRGKKYSGVQTGGFVQHGFKTITLCIQTAYEMCVAT
jgi:hypothetical protein